MTIALRKIGRWLCEHWKQILGVTFKLALIVIGAFFAFALCVIGYEEWYDRYGPCGGRMINQRNKIYVQYYSDNTERIKNLQTGKWASPKARWFANEPAQDSISVYCDRDGKRGFYNSHTGKIIIPGTYLHAWYFSDGVAAVVNDDGRLRFIDYDGNQAVPGSYYYSPGYDYVFKDGYCEAYNDSTGGVGILRKDGTWALEQEYQWITRYESAGVWRTRRDGRWQLWNNDFTPALEGSFDALELADDYDAVYTVRDHIKQRLTLDGRILEPFIIDGTYELHYTVKHNADEADEYEIVPEVVVYKVDGYEGLMDKRTGRILTPAVYQDFNMISRTLIKATFASWQLEGVIMDLKGQIIRYE